MMGTPNQNVDANQVGNVYLLQYDQGSGSIDELRLKRGHMSVLVDLAGECTEQEIKGIEYHLGADSQTLTTFFMNNRRVRSRNSFLRIANIGRIQNPFHTDQPANWEAGLHTAVKKWHNEWFLQKADPRWSSSVNCQQFARVLVGKLQLQWPADWKVVGDVAPDIIDFALLLAGTSAKSSSMAL